MTSSANLVACLTPPGRGAVAVLGLRGDRAWHVVRELFRSRQGAELPAVPETGRFWLGRFGLDVADEVIVAVKGAEPVPLVEVQCHGGPEVVRYLVELVTARGFQTCSWADFLRGAEVDSLAAAAAVALAGASSLRTAAILLDQYRGAYAAALRRADEARTRGDRDGAARILKELARYAPVGRHLTTPWRVVIAGAPNVGKSSLVNALAGYQRSVVAPTPGTTRDVVTTQLVFDGWPVEVADTAGLRSTPEKLEQIGVSNARAAMDDADLVLWVVDGSSEPVYPDAQSATLKLIVNKADLAPAWNWPAATNILAVSAETGVGLPELCRAIADWLVPDPPPPGAAVPFTAELCDAAEVARRAVEG